MSVRSITFLVATLAVMASPLAAQKGKGPKQVPRGHYPPSGMCRIWIEGVPPGRQPKATDCATAYRRAPSNARVITSDGRTYRGRVYDTRRDGDYRRDDEYRRDGDGDLKRQEGDRKSDGDRTSDGRTEEQRKRDAELKRATEQNRKTVTR